MIPDRANDPVKSYGMAGTVDWTTKCTWTMKMEWMVESVVQSKILQTVDCRVAWNCVDSRMYSTVEYQLVQTICD